MKILALETSAKSVSAAVTENGTVLACMNDPALGSDFLIDGVTRDAPSLRFVQRLDNPPEFPDADVECGLKALVFRQGV